MLQSLLLLNKLLGFLANTSYKVSFHLLFTISEITAFIEKHSQRSIFKIHLEKYKNVKQIFINIRKKINVSIFIKKRRSCFNFSQKKKEKMFFLIGPWHNNTRCGMLIPRSVFNSQKRPNITRCRPWAIQLYHGLGDLLLDQQYAIEEVSVSII